MDFFFEIFEMNPFSDPGAFPGMLIRAFLSLIAVLFFTWLISQAYSFLDRSDNTVGKAGAGILILVCILGILPFACMLALMLFGIFTVGPVLLMLTALKNPVILVIIAPILFLFWLLGRPAYDFVVIIFRRR